MSYPFHQALDDAADAVFRDFGDYGKHSKRCVYIRYLNHPTEWCCADDCEIARRQREKEHKVWPWHDDGEKH